MTCIRQLPLLAVLAAGVTLALAAGCSSGGGETVSQEQTRPGIERLADVHRIDELRAAFNARPGVPRLILLLSPT